MTARVADTPRVAYLVSNDLVKASSLLPSNKNRSILVHSLVKSYGLLSRPQMHVAPPIPADINALMMYHSRDFIECLLDPRTCNADADSVKLEQFGIEEDCPAFRGLGAYVKLVAGAVLTATKQLSSGESDIAICWDGGRHHAQKSRASGFCYLADCVLAMLALKRMRIPTPVPPSTAPPRKARIMYLDLDLHFSDGVSHAFHRSNPPSGPPQILTLSIHHAAPGFFPSSPLAALPDPDDAALDPFTLSLPLARGASNASMLRVWRSVECVRDAFAPDYVVVQCGADGLVGDPYAVWNWALGGEGGFGWCVQNVCQWGSKVLLLGGGGYNSPNVARAWTYLTSIALGEPLALDTDIPDHQGFPLYSPSFTLDVPMGNARDENTEEDLHSIEQRFVRIAEIIRQRVQVDD